MADRKPPQSLLTWAVLDVVPAQVDIAPEIPTQSSEHCVPTSAATVAAVLSMLNDWLSPHKLYLTQQ